MSRLIRERLLNCLPADVKPPDGIRILLHDEPTVPVKTESYSRNDPLRQPIETDPGPARERANRLRYEHGPFKGHRGILLGTPVTPHSKLWRTLVAMYDERRGRELWEPGSPIRGRVIALDLTLGRTAAEEGIENGHYAAIWISETRLLPNRARVNRIATTGADPDQPDPRVLGPLLQAVIDHEAERGEHAGDSSHPIRRVLTECEARDNTKLASG